MSEQTADTPEPVHEPAAVRDLNVDQVETAPPAAPARPRDAEDRVEFFTKRSKGDTVVWWRFRAAGNSAVMGGPAEGYADLETALAGARRVVGRDLVFVDREVSGDGREIRAYAEDGLEPPELHTLPPVD